MNLLPKHDILRRLAELIELKHRNVSGGQQVAGQPLTFRCLSPISSASLRRKSCFGSRFIP